MTAPSDRRPAARLRRRAALSAIIACTVLLAAQAKTIVPIGAAEAIDVPNGSPAELLTFIAEVKQREPKETDHIAIRENLIAIENAVVVAADKINEATPNEQQRTAAVSEKLAALMVLRRLQADDADKRFQDYLADVARDPHPYVPPLGKIYVLATQLQEVDHGNHAELEKLTADVRAHVKSSKPDKLNLSIAYQTALADERAGLDKLAAEAYREFAAAFAQSEDPFVVENAKKLEGAARLLELPGGTMRLQGKLLDGTEFDAKKYEGKTVLVVFWATWCGPCVAELPILKEAYARYQERGFEIITVSLDDDRRRLEDFVKREELKWPVLFDGADDKLGWNHPLAAYYGILGLPRSIMIGKDGKVTSIDAYGEAVWDLLARAIGPAVVKEAPVDEEPADRPATTPGEKDPK